MPSGLWRDPGFRRLWIGQTISEIGTRVSREGIPLTAVLVLEADASQMGMLVALGGAATLVAGPWAGWHADRARRKPTMIAADLGRALLLGLIPLAAWQGWLSLWLLFGVVGLAGVLTVFFDVAYQSYLPSLVPGERLMEGNSKLQLTASTAEVIGPAFTGFLVQLLTAPVAILVDAVSFLLSAASIALIGKREEAVDKQQHAGQLRDMFAGAGYVFGHQLLRPLALRAVTAAFFWGFFSTLYVIYAVRELGIGPAALGVIIALGGVSSFIGAVLVERIVARFALGRTLIGATILSGLAALLIPLGEGPFRGGVCLAASQLFGDIAFPVYNVPELTLRQKIAPPHLLGRVNACMQMLFKGVWPIGALVGGTLATYIGMRATLLVCGLGVLASSLWLIASPVRRQKS
jgi:predicted MFS family arabinose efflux permease